MDAPDDRVNARLDQAYPPELKRREDALIHRRRNPGSAADELPATPVDDAIGIAVSGGGIRSATFALGVFQALSQSRFLRKVDYVSSVSGGGYFAGFFGGLFVPRGLEQTPPLPKDTEDAFRRVDAALASDSSELHYLRENGRYLAPAGSDDMWLGGAVLLRNWAALQIVLASALLLGFVALEVATYEAQIALFVVQACDVVALLDPFLNFGLRYHLWLSPWWLLLGALLLGLALPVGASYWLIGTVRAHELAAGGKGGFKEQLARSLQQLVALGILSSAGLHALLNAGTVAIGGVCAVVAACLARADHQTAAYALGWITCVAYATETTSYRAMRDQRLIAWIVVGALFAIALCVYATGFFCVYQAALAGLESVRAVHPAKVHPLWPMPPARACAAVLIATFLAFGSMHWILARLFRGALERHQDHVGLGGLSTTRVDEEMFARHSVSVWLSRILIAGAAIALVAALQTAGRSLYAAWDHLGLWVSASAGSFLTFAASARKLAVMFAGATGGKRPRGSSAALLYVAGFGALLVLLVALSGIAEAIVYRGADLFTPATAEARVDDVRCVLPDYPTLEQPTLALATAQWTMALLLVTSLVFGFSHRFLNGSTHLPLYAGRITRAFLGASNPVRTGNVEGWSGKLRTTDVTSPKAATHVIPGDDIRAADYWRLPDARAPEAESPYLRGAPLHLINVTINETVDVRSQIQQHDRKGLGMALGPCGVSAGVRHHAIMSWQNTLDCRVASGDSSYRVFDYKQTPARAGASAGARRFDGELLSIGTWLGISGAAFSTGTGLRTNVGLSLLAGLANVRLGYWWNSGVARASLLARVLGIFFWVHHYLRRELLARFPGTANLLWYLSDGGHFENMGGYELIRRKVRQIVLVDAEADADYGFEGLGNFVRKARIDFGAEIEFLSHDQNDGTARMASMIDESLLGYIGSLDEMTRGAWERTDALALPASALNGHKRHRVSDIDESHLSLAHAAVARVTYADGTRGTLLYVKPTLIGDEPADVLRYHREHPAFPHETTGDQFFDEAQWESYRALGEHIGRKLFKKDKSPFV
jgi:hypothetical protein